MSEIFLVFNSISSFFYALLLLAGLSCWCVVGIYRFIEICKTRKRKDKDVNS